MSGNGKKRKRQEQPIRHPEEQRSNANQPESQQSDLVALASFVLEHLDQRGHDARYVDLSMPLATGQPVQVLQFGSNPQVPPAHAHVSVFTGDPPTTPPHAGRPANREPPLAPRRRGVAARSRTIPPRRDASIPFSQMDTTQEQKINENYLCALQKMREIIANHTLDVMRGRRRANDVDAIEKLAYRLLLCRYLLTNNRRMYNTYLRSIQGMLPDIIQGYVVGEQQYAEEISDRFLCYNITRGNSPRWLTALPQETQDVVLQSIRDNTSPAMRARMDEL